MIFADLEYLGSYDDAHDGLVRLLRLHFTRVEAGHQGDSWIWVEDGAAKVMVDTFSAMAYQLKSDASGEHVQRVLEILGAHYRLRLRQPPERKGMSEGALLRSALLSEWPGG